MPRFTNSIMDVEYDFLSEQSDDASDEESPLPRSVRGRRPRRGVRGVGTVRRPRGPRRGTGQRRARQWQGLREEGDRERVGRLKQERLLRMKKVVSEMNEVGLRDLAETIMAKVPALMIDVLERKYGMQGQEGLPTPGPHQQDSHPLPDPQPTPDLGFRCCCGNCRPMPTLREKKCCGFRPEDCLSAQPLIEQVVLDPAVLQTAIGARHDILAGSEETDLRKASRHAAYRQFTYMRHGTLGQGIRRVIPSCVVWAIRDRYPDPDGHYIGFLPSRLGDNENGVDV